METRSPARPRDGELDEVLRELNGPGLYRNNVFRLTGLPVTASPTMVRRRREEAALLAQLGTPATPSGALPPAAAPDPEAVTAAFEALRNPVLRLVHELLWLWNTGEDNEHDYAVRRHCTALEGPSLTAPDRPEITEDPLGQQWLVALQAWAQVLDGEEIWDRARQRVKEIDDPRLTTGTVRRLRDRLPRHLIGVHLAFAVKAAEELGPEAADRHLWVLDESSFDDELVDTVLRDAVRPAEDRVRAACEAANRTAETTPLEAVPTGHALLEQTAKPLRTIGGVLGAVDPVTNAVHDEVARAANFCAVAHHRAASDTGPALELIGAARELARERTTIELLDANSAVLGRGMVLSEVDDLCQAGRVDEASDRLREWHRRTTDEAVRAQIVEALLDPLSLCKPQSGAPPAQGSFLGWGVHLRGHRRTAEEGMYVATHYLTAFFIPVIPMAAYLRDARYIYGKVPMSRATRWWRLLVPLAILVYFTEPLEGGVGLLVFLFFAVLIAAETGSRRYQVHRWVSARVGGE